MIDIQEKKTKILEFLKQNGPSLPVKIARSIQMEPVFASAILSELIQSKQIKTSNMRIGSSPLYLIPGQEEQLEKEKENLKSAELSALNLLKSKTIIIDEEESPTTRVALRNIKDFAIPFKFKDKITWKYAFAPEEKINKILNKQNKPIEKEEIKEEKPVPKAWEVKKEEIKKAKEETKPKESPKTENIFENETPKETKPKEKSKSFLETIEAHLEKQGAKISSIEEVDKKKVIAIINSEETKTMLFAFNKLRITEAELMKCYKEASKKNLKYQIITKGLQTKKLTETINAYQSLSKIDKLEN